MSKQVFSAYKVTTIWF